MKGKIPDLFNKITARSRSGLIITLPFTNQRIVREQLLSKKVVGVIKYFKLIIDWHRIIIK